MYYRLCFRGKQLLDNFDVSNDSSRIQLVECHNLLNQLMSCGWVFNKKKQFNYYCLASENPRMDEVHLIVGLSMGIRLIEKYKKQF